MIAGYKISSQQEDVDFSVVHGFIAQSYWAKSIPESTLKTALENSLCFSVLTTTNQQVGFARVITDCATYAYLADVFILEPHRGKGLSKWLMSEITQHPKLQKLRRFGLVTKDAQGLYKQFGFEKLANPDFYMEVWRPEVYQAS